MKKLTEKDCREIHLALYGALMSYRKKYKAPVLRVLRKIGPDGRLLFKDGQK